MRKVQWIMMLVEWLNCMIFHIKWHLHLFRPLHETHFSIRLRLEFVLHFIFFPSTKAHSKDHQTAMQIFSIAFPGSTRVLILQNTYDKYSSEQKHRSSATWRIHSKPYVNQTSKQAFIEGYSNKWIKMMKVFLFFVNVTSGGGREGLTS